MNSNITSWLADNAVAIILATVSFVSIYAVNNYRLSSLEDRQNRQGTAIAAIQTQQTDQAKDIASIKASVDSIKDNVNYIRSRIDAAVK